MRVKTILWLVWMTVFTFGIIASCLALASYDMVNKYGKDIHFKKDGSQEKSNLAVISWIQNGILTNAILSVVVIFIFEIFSFPSLCSMAGPCTRGIKKAGKGFLVALSLGLSFTMIAICVHFSSLAKYVSAIKDLGQENMNTALFNACCVFIGLTAASLQAFTISSLLILDDNPQMLESMNIK